MSAATTAAGLYAPGVSPGSVPWPGGSVPYVFDAGIPAAQQAVYLNGLREYELAANVHFVPRTAETQYVLFKYNPLGPNRVSGSQPQVVEVNSLTRGQICHEMGHSFGLEHEHQRADRGPYVEVLSANIVPGNEALFAIASGATAHGAYDFESVMHYGRDTLSVQPGVRDTLRAKAGYEKYQRRMGNAALSSGDRALMAFLYGPPAVAPSALVTTTADGGPGSLRAAIYYASDHPGTPVSFDIPGGGAGGTVTIRPKAWLPPLAKDGIVIDGSTQPGSDPLPRVRIEGSQLAAEEGGNVPGIFFLEGTCTVKGLAISGFPWCGMAMQYADARLNRVSGCSSKQNAFQGILISDGPTGNVIEGCVLSGNSQYGVWISGEETLGNVVTGCRIGTTDDGSAASPNLFGGIILTGATHHDMVENNLISGNVNAGLWVTGEGVDEHMIRGNRFGTNASESGSIPNTFVGAYVIDGASHNLVEGNLFSGNTAEGLRLAGTGTTANVVRGNRALANGYAGVTLFNGAADNLIEDNVLSANGSAGLVIAEAGTSGNRARRNFIGTDATGMIAAGNGFAGVQITGGCSGNWLGDGPGTGNLISANATYGVFVDEAGAGGNTIWNNRIGPDANGAASFNTQFDGIIIGPGAGGTRVGGSEAGAANLIRGQLGRGIVLFKAEAVGNSFRRNSISANGWDGIALYEGANRGIVAPVIATASLGLTTAVTGSFAGEATTAYRIEYFASQVAGTAGELFIGEKLVTTNGAGAVAIDVALPARVRAGRFITAMATAVASGDSSMFSNAVAVTTVDGDLDGMPDDFEDSVPGLSKTTAADAPADLDGDGMSNRDEFFAGTDPRGGTSRLLATGQKVEGGFRVSFPSVAGVIYRVEAADSLPGVWRTAAIHLLGTGATMEVVVPAVGDKGFFRLAN